MTREELIALAITRHGGTWKSSLAEETGWSWHTFNNIERKPDHKVSRKLAKAVDGLPKKPSTTSA